MRLEKLSLILHFYQPSIQNQAKFKQIFESSYLPLLRIFKSKKNCRFTLNIPLSFLELADMYGYTSWLSDIAKLYEQGVVELTGSASYHPLLNSIPENIRSDEIILQEYGLGYYFGRHKGFDGENEILIKDIKGFFPPELAVDSSLCSLLHDLGYSWLLIDECGVADFNFQLVQHTSGIHVLIRNTEISNILAFHRGYKTDNIFSKLKEYEHEHLVLALDAETFGHHNKEGVVLLDTLIDQLQLNSVRLVSASDIYNDLRDIRDQMETKDILKSSWGASSDDVKNSKPIPIWHSDSNKLQQNIWDLMRYMFTIYSNLEYVDSTTNFSSNVAIWKKDALTNAPISLRVHLETKFMLLKLFESDFLWWSSKTTLFNGIILFDANIIRTYVSNARLLGKHVNDNRIDYLCDLIEANL